MQNLFNAYTGPKVGLSIDANWKYVRSGLQRNIAQAVLYYRSKNFSVKSNHILARFLNSSGTSIEGDIVDFYNRQIQNGIRSSSIFKMTSSVNRGDIFYGDFFGAGSKEILIACDDYQNPLDLEANWRDIEAVKFLDHPKSDTSILLANGKAYSAETGYSVISVNIPALLVQYRCWLKEQKTNNDLGKPTFSTSVFIHKYVLPNMLNSQLDVAIFNRLNNHLLGAPMGVPMYRHAFVLVDFNDRADKILKDVIKKFNRTDRDIHTMMREVPLIHCENLLELSELPSNAPTRQLVWAEVIARIKLINFLLEANPSGGHKQSRQELNYIKKVLDLFESSGGLEQIPDRVLVRDIEAEIIRVRLAYKR